MPDYIHESLELVQTPSRADGAYLPTDAALQAKHVAFVANSSWSIWQYRLGVIRTLLGQGAHVSVIAPADRATDSLIALGCDFYPLRLEAKSTNPLNDWHCFSQLLRLYGKLRPDCVFHYTIKPNIYGGLAAWLRRVPCIAVITGLGFAFINDNPVARIARSLYRISLHAPRQVWFLNTDDAREFASRRLVNVERSAILPGEGIDAGYYAPRQNQVSGSTRPFRFLLIARMLWDKGIGEYVEAARKIKRQAPDIVFQLLGPADVQNPRAISRAQLLEWEKEGVIEYLGTAPDVRPAIGQADCVVLPSYREGMPRTLLEAAAMEKPIVATDVPGCRDIVRDGITGRLCKPRSAGALQDAMLDIARMPRATLKTMGQSARHDAIQRFGERRVIEIYLKTLRNLCRDSN
ncbi:glycosyltransferase family 4 protein [Cupriavidus oxalaticus]|uniref:Glycosyltransferase family 1 protein n=1 Tax=Cupriavidus oxalaticus TaxID=96344 RepID=A0A4P7LEQ4_9BURK|nr:glycosyltransferase family 4 protein [Cupriavidus oxalaticus]QBY54018.1 glycosyltransferase family 1 protein [Cupriavidus oxalaticus]